MNPWLFLITFLGITIFVAVLSIFVCVPQEPSTPKQEPSPEPEEHENSLYGQSSTQSSDQLSQMPPQVKSPVFIQNPLMDRKHKQKNRQPNMYYDDDDDDMNNYSSLYSLSMRKRELRLAAAADDVGQL